MAVEIAATGSGAPSESQVGAILAKHPAERSALIPILQEVQAKLGYLPEEAMCQVAEALGVPEANVYGVASFYAQFRFAPIGRKQVHVCRGTACHVGGAPKILAEVKERLGIGEGESTPDREYSLETVACIGCCALAPCAVVDGKVEAKLTPKKVRELFQGVQR
ncbi:MAG: NADH-quinone oxidoreductase subunit NuoE [Armatimonadetes bacterium]|nr:NADH-quinone oxidoreductase subunit NuoE [Armatimonadota bacterium]